MEERIRDYKIIRKLGEGGMGSVYLANDLMLERQVAIKVLSPLLTKDLQFTERFRHEAKVQASLIHPNIIGLYNYFQEDDHYCMVMEYVEGDTLKHLVSNTGPLPEQRAIWILSQILEAVGFAHKRRIIHRDIKPSNILISKDDTVKVLDFGIAKILQEKGLTKTGTKMGTIYYMSPEQIKALKDIDHRTDIYSIGVTFYEMLSGRVPFNVDTDSDFEIMNEIVTGEIKDPREFYPHISNWVVDVLYASVNKDRNSRIQSAQEFMNRLLAKDAGIHPVISMEKTMMDTPEPPVVQSTPQIKKEPVVSLKKDRSDIVKSKPEIKTLKKKSSAKKFAIFSLIGVAFIITAILIFKPDSNQDDSYDPLDEPFVVEEHNPGPHGPANPDFSSGKTMSNKNANWPASAMRSLPAY